MAKDMEQIIQQRLSGAASLLVEGEYPASMQVIRLLIADLGNEKVKDMMVKKIANLSGKCNAIIDAIRSALDAEGVDANLIQLNVRVQAALNVQWMAEEYYTFFIKVLSEQGLYNPS